MCVSDAKLHHVTPHRDAEHYAILIKPAKILRGECVCVDRNMVSKMRFEIF